MLGRLLRRASALFRKNQEEQDLKRELGFHLEMQVEENIRRGMSAADARAAALRNFGGVEQVKEQCRDVRGTRFLEDLLQDLRYGVRMAFKKPMFTAVVILTLALGIGANTAIFSLVYAVVLRPLPYSGQDRLVQIERRSDEIKGIPISTSMTEVYDWREGKSFEHIAAYMLRAAIAGIGDEQKNLTALYVTPELFRMLGAAPVLGRTFTAEEAVTGNNRVVVISHGLWGNSFGADPGVLGRSLEIDSRAYTIIGVMPEEFKFPDTTPPAIWLPLDESPQSIGLQDRKFIMFQTVGWLKPDVSLQQAQAEMNAIAAGLEEAYPETNRGKSIRLVPLLDRYIGNYRQMLLSLLGAVAFLLLIACANIASLFLARSAARQKEMAVRAALGASKFRLVRQMLTEGMIVAVAGGVAGLLMAYWALSAFVAIIPDDLPRLDEVHIDGQVLTFTLLATAITGLACGLAPALRSKDVWLNESLKDGGRGAMTGTARRRGYGVLVAAQVALALVLLIGAGLMLKSLASMIQREQGFDSENVLAMDLMFPYRNAAESEQMPILYKEIFERVKGMPGVESAALSFGYPSGGPIMRTPITAKDDTGRGRREAVVADWKITSTEYFKTLKVPLLAGRIFNENDTRNSPQVVLINQELADQLWPGGNSIGQRVILPNYVKPQPGAKTTEVEVIGVVGNIVTRGFKEKALPELYSSYEQSSPSHLQLIVRTSGDPTSYIAAIRNHVREVDKLFVIDRVITLDNSLGMLIKLPRFYTLMLSAFAGLALLLVTVGVYGVLSYSVSRRTQEIAIRIALGAQVKDILRIIMSWGVGITLAGIAAGLVGAWALTRVLESQLAGVSPTDPVTFAGISVLLLVIGLLACYVPARRATRVDPLVALRDE